MKQIEEWHIVWRARWKMVSGGSQLSHPPLSIESLFQQKHFIFEMEYNFELYVIMTVQPYSKCSFFQSNERMADELQQSNSAHRPRGRATAATSGSCLLLLRIQENTTTNRVESKYHGAKNEEKILSLKPRGKITVLYLTRIPGAPELLGQVPVLPVPCAVHCNRLAPA